MSSSAAITAGFACFALCSAIFNLWLYGLRPREAPHLWISVVSLGVAFLAAGGAAGYEADSLAEAQFAQLLAFTGAVPLVVGFMRFSATFLGVRIRELEIASDVYACAALLVSWGVPSLFFSGEEIHLIEPLGRRYVQAGLGPTAGLLLLGFVAVIGAAIALYARHWRALRGGPMLTAALVVWGALMTNDLCVAFGVYRGPWLTSVGFALFFGVLGAILLGRLVRSLAEVERSSAELQRLVEARTDLLRRKDLELAHGARLATLGALAAGIAHEIEQPLEPVSASVKELRDAWRDATRPGAFGALLATARGGVERIGGVVSQLLELARRKEGHVGEHDLAGIVASVLPIAGYELRRRAQLITLLGSAPRVRGDAAMLSQIVLNLLVGALGAFGDGPSSTRCRISVTTGERDGNAILEVADSAPGLAVDTAPRLFDASGADVGDDSRRLGLAVTHQLVARHGGAIEMESGPQGTLIRVRLPAAARGGVAA